VPARERSRNLPRVVMAMSSIVVMCSAGSLPCPQTTRIRPGRGCEEIHWRGPAAKRSNWVRPDEESGPAARRTPFMSALLPVFLSLAETFRFQSPHEDTRGRSRHAGRNASKGALLLSGSSASLAEEIEGGQPTGCPPSKLIYDRNSLRVSHNERLPTPSDRDVVQHDVARAHVIAVLHYDID